MATQIRYPIGLGVIGSSDSWTSSTASSKWLDIDDPVGSPDDASSYLYRQDSGANQDITFDPLTIPAGSTNIELYVDVRGSRTAAGACAFRPDIRVGGTLRTGTFFTAETSWANGVSDVFGATNPATGSAWTVDEINGVGGNAFNNEARFTAAGMVAGEEIRCTQAYVRIEYTPAGGGLLPRLMSEGLVVGRM